VNFLFIFSIEEFHKSGELSRNFNLYSLSFLYLSDMAGGLPLNHFQLTIIYFSLTFYPIGVLNNFPNRFGKLKNTYYGLVLHRSLKTNQKKGVVK
ncbi:uncharacterized protein METZ01_LOCUS82578, partial [marine metagenome]